MQEGNMVDFEYCSIASLEPGATGVGLQARVPPGHFLRLAGVQHPENGRGDILKSATGALGS
jgi:hypothetical protein